MDKTRTWSEYRECEYRPVKMEKGDMLDQLMERVKYWKQSDEYLELFKRMYQFRIDAGCYDGIEWDVNKIVDNDCVNWCSIYEKGDTDYDEAIKVWHEGSRIYGKGYIEEVSDDEEMILVRWR